MFINNYNKGLSTADNKLKDQIIKTVCAYYLINNFIIKYFYILKPLFWRICCANLKARFESLIDEL